jgi:hypothetical protein
MAEIYFNGFSISVKEAYEYVCEDLWRAKSDKDDFIELSELYPYFDETKAKLVTGSKKTYIQIDKIICIKQ